MDVPLFFNFFSFLSSLLALMGCVALGGTGAFLGCGAGIFRFGLHVLFFLALFPVECGCIHSDDVITCEGTQFSLRSYTQVK